MIAWKKARKNKSNSMRRLYDHNTHMQNIYMYIYIYIRVNYMYRFLLTKA